MKRITVTACSGCPFNYYDDRAGGSLCTATEGAGYTPENARPDWCPLDAGPVLVSVGWRCDDELSGLHCILPVHGPEQPHRAPIVPSDPGTEILAWDDEGRVVAEDGEKREGGSRGL